MSLVKLWEKACLSNWFPIIEATGVKVPKTRIVTVCNIGDHIFGNDDEPVNYEDVIYRLRQAATELGGFPLFLRTGQTSAKHDWKNTCFVEKEEDLEKHIFRLSDYSECLGLFGLPYNVLVLRELLPTTPAFYHWNGLPITKERRYFVTNGKVMCHHEYWVEEAFEGKLTEDETELLTELNTQTPAEIQWLTKFTERATVNLEGFWSVDWLYTKHGWYLIDAAPGTESYHHPDCVGFNK